MNLSEKFRGALFRSFAWKPYLFTMCVLFFCGFLVSFFRGIEAKIGFWGFPLFPFFLISGLLLAMGVVLIRASQESSFTKALFGAWDSLLGCAFVGLPLFLVYFVLWFLLFVVVAARDLPIVGTILAIFLSCLPFILVFATIVLFIFTLALFFFGSVAVTRTSSFSLKETIAETLRPIQKDPFGSLVSLICGLIPLFVLGWILLYTQAVTEEIFLLERESFILMVLQWIFMLLPFVFFITPAVQFFFNFAAKVVEPPRE